MTEHYDVLIVGAGPAGLAAARAAASSGARVGLLDAQARAGGQVWRHDITRRASAVARRAQILPASVTLLTQHQVVASEGHRLLVETADGACRLEYGALILATGARELLMPFPGWTLPGVTGAGALQALAKQGWPVAGKRIVVAGSGPLLLAAAATLRAHGAHILGIHEQASSLAVAKFARQLLRWPARIVQAATLRARLAGVSYHCGSIVLRALGEQRLEAVEIIDAHGTRQVACDGLAVGYGLVPNVELASLLGCALTLHGRHPQVQADALLRTTVDDVFAAGEACGIGGLAAARIEGRIAGYAATGDDARATVLLPQRARAQRFAELLARQFALDPRLHSLATPQTIICRCEDVTLAALEGFSDARDAKLSTRCGMGSCQGRICGSALTELGRFPTRSSGRPPLFPTRLSSLALAEATHTFPDEYRGS